MVICDGYGTAQCNENVKTYVCERTTGREHWLGRAVLSWAVDLGGSRSTTMAAAAAGAVAQQIPSLLSALQLAASVGQINQSKAQHGEAIDKSVGMHQAQMEKSLELHQESIDNNTIYHQEQITLDQQLHQHSVDLEKHGWDRQHVQSVPPPEPPPLFLRGMMRCPRPGCTPSRESFD